MSQVISTFLMFTGRAEEAMDVYVSLFDDAEVSHISRYGPDGPGAEGTVMLAGFRLGSQSFLCIDSADVHDFAFNPAISIFVKCTDEAEIDRLFRALKVDGTVMMPLGQYAFSQKFAWVSDRFGVSWQLNLAHEDEKQEP